MYRYVPIFVLLLVGVGIGTGELRQLALDIFGTISGESRTPKADSSESTGMLGKAEDFRDFLVYFAYGFVLLALAIKLLLPNDSRGKVWSSAPKEKKLPEGKPKPAELPATPAELADLELPHNQWRDQVLETIDREETRRVREDVAEELEEIWLPEERGGEPPKEPPSTT